MVKACTSAGETEKGQKDDPLHKHLMQCIILCPYFSIEFVLCSTQSRTSKKNGHAFFGLPAFVFVCVHGVDIEWHTIILPYQMVKLIRIAIEVTKASCHMLVHLPAN